MRKNSVIKFDLLQRSRRWWTRWKWTKIPNPKSQRWKSFCLPWRFSFLFFSLDLSVHFTFNAAAHVVLTHLQYRPTTDSHPSHGSDESIWTKLRRWLYQLFLVTLQCANSSFAARTETERRGGDTQPQCSTVVRALPSCHTKYAWQLVTFIKTNFLHSSFFFFDFTVMVVLAFAPPLSNSPVPLVLLLLPCAICGNLRSFSFAAFQRLPGGIFSPWQWRPSVCFIIRLMSDWLTDNWRTFRSHNYNHMPAVETHRVCTKVW